MRECKNGETVHKIWKKTVSFKLSQIFAGFIVNVTRLKEDIKGSTTFSFKKVEWFHRVNGQLTQKNTTTIL